MKLFLMIYVDDFKLSGPAENLALGWKIIKEAVDMGETEPTGLFLGCLHKRFERTRPDGTQVKGIEYDMESYLKSAVEHYEEVYQKLTGQNCVLKPVKTPFLNEDTKDCPA